MKSHRRFIYLSWLLLIGFSIIGASGLMSPKTTYAASRTAKTAHADLQVKIPKHTTSIYEYSVSPSLSQQQGCKAAQGPAGLVVLDFAEPFSLHGVYGTDIFSGTFASDNTIAQAVDNFILGAWNCRTTSTKLKVAVGTSNYSRGLGSNLTAWSNAGYAWGKMVNDIQSYIVSQGYAQQFTAYAADDIETDEAHHWGTYAETVNFVNAYNAATKQLLVDYGDDPGGINPAPWTAEQLWYVASGAPDDVALPEIYYKADATADWEQLDKWACANKGQAMKIIGTMAEYPYGKSNKPARAFRQMYNAMGADSCTANARNQLIYSTNI